MISLIICSRDKQKLQEVIKSAENTIGVAYEVIVIDNSEGKYSIFQAYNEGIRNSSGDMLCFMHEDITFKTNDWGQKIAVIFEENSNIGLIGIAGSSYKSRVPTHWSFPDALAKTSYINIIQHYKDNKIIHHYNNPRQENFSQVVAVDGVWFCARKDVFNKISFDDRTFFNFHGYDVDFSLSVNKCYRVVVTFDILIEHLSPGNFNKTWLSETIKLHAKWCDNLPVDLEILTKQEQYLEEKKALIWLISKMDDINFADFSALKFIWQDVRLRFGYAGMSGFLISFAKYRFNKTLSNLIG